MAVAHYKELRVWQKAIDLVELVYTTTKAFPQEELYSLTKQIRRAAVSVPSNIAEGQGRTTTGEFKQFLGTARGSLYEVETQLVIAERLGYISQRQVADVALLLNDLSKMIQGLIAALPDRHQPVKKPQP